jgi:hypothetical protein
VRLDHLLSKEHTAHSRVRHRDMGSSHVEHWLVGAHGRFRPRTPHLLLSRSRGRLHRTPCSLDVNYSVLRESHRAQHSCCGARDLSGRAHASSVARPRHVLDPQWANVARAAQSLENCRASTSINIRKQKNESQATKSQRWMPWRQMPMKDVDGCDKPRGAAYQASIRGSPNGETRQGSCPVTPP